MRTFAALAGLGFAALLVTGCQTEAACPEIAQAPVVALTVAREYAGSVKSLRLKACQDGRCTEAELELFPGSTSVDQGCEPGSGGGDRPCSATSSPDGTPDGDAHAGSADGIPHRGYLQRHGPRRPSPAGPDPDLHARVSPTPMASSAEGSSQPECCWTRTPSGKPVSPRRGEEECKSELEEHQPLDPGGAVGAAGFGARHCLGHAGAAAGPGEGPGCLGPVCQFRPIPVRPHRSAARPAPSSRSLASSPSAAAWQTAGLGAWRWRRW